MSSDFSDIIENESYSSLPSKGVNQSDIPIPSDIESSFQYNYFVKDETTSREVIVEGSSETAFITLTSDSSEADRRQALIEFDLPRFNKVSWTPTELESKIESTEAVTFDVSIADNVDNILLEEVMTSNQYSGINFQDAEGLSKLTDMAKIAINTSDLPFNFASSETSSTSTDSNLDVINSYLETVGETTGLDSTAKESLRNALSSYQSMGDLSFFNRASEREALVNDSFSNSKTTFDLGVSVSNVLANRCGIAWSKDGGSSFFEEINSIKATLSKITSAALSQDTAGSISDDDYDISGSPVLYRVSQNMADQTSGDEYTARVVGYLIEKDEVDSDGNVVTLDPIVVENSLAGDVIDPNIMYGRGYRYRVRTIAYVEFSAINVYPGNESRNQTVVVGMLIGSRPSKTTTAICIERIPPKHPVELQFIWNGNKQALDIIWAFPLNRQRDIKQFRIFRRTNIQQPFNLIKNYFFNDSTTLTKTGEIPDPDSLVSTTSSRLSGALIQVVSSPQLLYSDPDFNFNSSFIYALTSVDARGLSSNYSAQFRVTYDKFKGRIDVEYLSSSGAPIPYPNLYLRNDLFVDTIKTSGFDQMTIYFDPEYLTVTEEMEENGTAEHDIISTNNDTPSYKMSMINLDNQKSKMIDIYVRDIRDDLFDVEEGIEYNVTTRVSTLIDV